MEYDQASFFLGVLLGGFGLWLHGCLKCQHLEKRLRAYLSKQGE